MVAAPKTERERLASILAIARNVSVPFGAPYFFELTTAPNVIWTDVKKWT